MGTVGSLDMGGGSLQVAFEVEEDVSCSSSGMADVCRECLMLLVVSWWSCSVCVCVCVCR